MSKPLQLTRRVIHWRLTAARTAVYRATLYRRQLPGVYAKAKRREDAWTRLWLRTYGVGYEDQTARWLVRFALACLRLRGGVPLHWAGGRVSNPLFRRKDLT